MTKDNSQYPVMDLADIPVKTLELVDARLTTFENTMADQAVERDTMLAGVATRSLNTQAGLRVLYMLVGGIILTMLLTGC